MALRTSDFHPSGRVGYHAFGCKLVRYTGGDYLSGFIGYSGGPEHL